MDKKKRNDIIMTAVFGILFVAMVWFIWGNSMVSGEESGGLSKKVADFLKPIFDPANKIDYDYFHYAVRKFAHGTEFAALGVVTSGLLYSVGKLFGVRLVSMRLFTVLFVAVCDEFLQNFTGRGSSVVDVMIDFGGGVFGILLWIAFIGLVLTVQRHSKRG